MSNTSDKKICVSIMEETVEQALSRAKEAALLADVVEIRLDGLAQPAIAPFIEGIDKPLLFTNRPVWEGGRFSGDESSRVALLCEAAKAGAAYVDIEVKTASELRNEVLAAATAGGKTKVIASWHSLTVTPSAQGLAAIFQEEYRSGAHIGKIVTMARTPLDVVRVLQLLEEAAEIEFPMIAFCMGLSGVVSRVATVELGGFMTYAAPDGGVLAASGQLPVSTLRKILAGLNDAN
jgi:3-dehydroquinate dehydratase-1/3-dehydroquinate dehydratase/shikimate dehydrogenase